MQEQIEKDLKSAMLGGDKAKAEVLRGLKGALLNEAIALSKKDEGLSDDEIQKVLVKEAKKRQESADIYKNAGETERADKELSEKTIIDIYLPEQVSEEEINNAVTEAIASTGASSASDMGKVIGVVRAKFGASADGALIAKIAKEKLTQ